MFHVKHFAITEAQANRVDRFIRLNRMALNEFESNLLLFNQKHNIVSGTAGKYLFEHHIKHCMALTCFEFPPGARIVDWGSGGGLPAIPLAVSFPAARIEAVDKVDKKMQAVSAIVRRLGLKNVSVFHGRAEDYHNTAMFSVSRATAQLSTLWEWHIQVTQPATETTIDGSHGPKDAASLGSRMTVEKEFWLPGLICLKGGDLSEEIRHLKDQHPDVCVSILSLEKLFHEPYYQEKVIVHVQRSYDSVGSGPAESENVNGDVIERRNK